MVAQGVAHLLALTLWGELGTGPQPERGPPGPRGRRRDKCHLPGKTATTKGTTFCSKLSAASCRAPPPLRSPGLTWLRGRGCTLFCVPSHLLRALMPQIGGGGSRAGGEGPRNRHPQALPGGCPAAAGLTTGADAHRERLLGLIHHATLRHLVIMSRSASPALKHRRWRAGGAAWVCGDERAV